MIGEVDQRLQEWLEGAAPAIAVSFGRPAATSDSPIIHVHLMTMEPGSQISRGRHVLLTVMLRYLVTVMATEPKAAHRILGTLLAAAAQHPDCEVDLAPLPWSGWSALGVMPQPSFFLCVPMELRRQPTQVPLVKKFQPSFSELQPLHGIVIGPDNVPVPGAVIRVPGTNTTATTDHRGQFQLAGVPVHPPVTTLQVRAKGNESIVNLGNDGPYPERVVIHYQPSEV